MPRVRCASLMLILSRLSLLCLLARVLCIRIGKPWRITCDFDKRLSLVLQWVSVNRLSLHMSFITGIIHALVEQDNVCANVLSVYTRTEAQWHTHMSRKRASYIQSITSMLFCVRL